jgi:hypothetical protein
MKQISGVYRNRHGERAESSQIITTRLAPHPADHPAPGPGHPAGGGRAGEYHGVTSSLAAGPSRWPERPAPVVGLWPDASPTPASRSGKPVAVLLGTAETSHTAGVWQVAAGQLGQRPIAVASGADHQILRARSGGPSRWGRPAASGPSRPSPAAGPGTGPGPGPAAQRQRAAAPAGSLGVQPQQRVQLRIIARGRGDLVDLCQPVIPAALGGWLAYGAAWPPFALGCPRRRSARDCPLKRLPAVPSIEVIQLTDSLPSGPPRVTPDGQRNRPAGTCRCANSRPS